MKTTKMAQMILMIGIIKETTLPCIRLTFIMLTYSFLFRLLDLFDGLLCDFWT